MKFTPNPVVSTAELVTRYESGQSLWAIAKHVPMSALGIRARLLKAGVKMRPRRQGQVPSHTHPVKTSVLVARYLAGESSNQIGRSYGLTGKTIVARLKSAGITRRTRADYPGLSMEQNPNWRGGRYITDHGYVTIRRNGRQMFEHRAIMEEALGRPLKHKEHVHHCNGIRTDNRRDNLVVLDASTHKREGWTLVKALQTRVRELEDQLKCHLATTP